MSNLPKEFGCIDGRVWSKSNNVAFIDQATKSDGKESNIRKKVGKSPLPQQTYETQEEEELYLYLVGCIL